MSIKRVKLGIASLDELLEGGLPMGGIILIAGGPGTGKTTLSTQFLYNGAIKFNERGIYVSFSENADTFKRHMLSMEFDFEKLEKEGKILILDLVTVGEMGAIDTTLNLILEKVRTFGAKRLVIDSLASLIFASEKKTDIRVLVSLLQKFLRTRECTTFLITETPWGSKGIGAGVEEFIADGIIMLQTLPLKGELKRRMAILKMRGANHDMRFFPYSITKGKGVVITPYPVVV